MKETDYEDLGSGLFRVINPEILKSLPCRPLVDGEVFIAYGRLKEKSRRYQIVSDDSGHDYFIPVGQEALFYQWVEATENDEESDLDFDDCRIDGRFTFTDPKVE